jgi:hypothetical protein
VLRRVAPAKGAKKNQFISSFALSAIFAFFASHLSSGAEIPPSTSGGALRFCDHKRAARGGGCVKTLGKSTGKNLRRADFCLGARCAFVITKAQRATYGAQTLTVPPAPAVAREGRDETWIPCPAPIPPTAWRPAGRPPAAR